MASFRSSGAITFTHNGDLKKTESFLKKMLKLDLRSKLERYGQKGVSALASATPKDSGKTAESWSYEITQDEKGISISWSNSNVNKGVNIAVILRYGHGTKNGGYVKGRDYITPAIRPIFDAILKDVWKEVAD